MRSGMNFAKKLLMQCFDAMRLSKRGYDSPRLAAGSFICSMECDEWLAEADIWV